MQTLRFPRRGFVAGAVFLALLPSWRVVLAAGGSDAIVTVQRLNDGLLQIMKAGRGAPIQQRFATLGPIIDRTFALNVILQASVGPSWETLSHDQQAMLEDAFRRYTIASYVNSFDDYAGQRFEIAPDTRAAGNDEIVQTKIIPVKGDSHELDYVMRQTDGSWRVVDVLAEGAISRVAVQRSDFRRLLSRGGAQALADSLRTKASDLSAGMG